MKLVELRKDGRSTFVMPSRVTYFLMEGWELAKRTSYAATSN
jgi:hypothetical protein